jgi:protein SCO1/2
MRYGRVAGAVLVIAAILAGEWLWLNAGRNRDLPAITAQAMAPGGPFSLVDHFARPVTDQSFRGKYVVMVFGYTSCPDVCPAILTSVAAAMDLLEAKAQAVQPVFVTVDPQRDTPAVLAKYVAAFHPRLLGLTGSPAQIRQITRDYRVYVSTGEGGHGGNPIDHSAYVYVLGPDGRMLTYLKPDATPQAMAEVLERVITQQSSVDGLWH